MDQVTVHIDMATLKARIQQFLKGRDGSDVSVHQIWEAAPWRRDDEQGRDRWDWVTIRLLEAALRDMIQDGNWGVREVVHNPHYRFELPREDISSN
jgi:hypothetical protein